ncbi:TetR family transcriptional regulator [Murinocardiopsis flavida]|uniref:TetR family transcriptional regulator n=1 Tax=Murinocardiopsis flavida TaxID=645275 RepID=A0A2P8DLB5_9ACTN|nr:TetR/AcrR family transcriptional regulator [Murinocardiopsis flavida]PSK98015.1 TetR family transcriptional regulator [Murinocardiopsis flavida]
MTSDRPYHHGDLRAAVLAAAVDAIAESGPAGIRLRDLARRAGVSHAAPAYHFGDKAGLLTALAAEGFALLADDLQRTGEQTGSFHEVGVAYVRFAIGHPAHFAVMFQPDLYHPDDPGLLAARARADSALSSGIDALSDRQAGPDPGVAGTAAWSLVHGFATLWLTGALPGTSGARSGDDPEAVARAVVDLLFRA